ncbi:MAG: hypothetical protein JWP97_5933 [Labilithrix sp.]|nr:hypothetical protein [Labilithrix sp.]
MKNRLLLLLCVGTLAAFGCSSPDDAATSSDDLSESDLAGKPFIEQGTYTGASGFARTGVETEATFAASCTDGLELVKMLHASKDGKTGYQKVKTPNVEQAYSTEYGVDQMLWDADSHALREQTPFIWLTIESGRFEPDSGKGTGERELSLGTDIMDDTYYDTADFILTDNEMELRARARWDTPTEIRRILIGNKVGSSVDALGIKKAAKEDMRQDSASAANIASLDTDTRRGFVKWNGTDAPATPVREVYEQLAKGGKLPDVGAHKQVLLLEPQIHLRQTRSRFHLNETSWNALNAVRQLGPDRLRKVGSLIAEARAAKALSAADEALVSAWEKKSAGAQDGTLLAERAADAVKKIDAAADVTPAGLLKLVTYTGSTPTTAVQLEARRVASEAESAIYHELGTELDAIRRLVTMSTDRTLENEPARFVRWLKSADNAALGTTKAQLALLRTYDRFVDLHAALVALPAATRDAQLTAYNEFAKAKVAAKDEDFDTFVPLTADNFPFLGRQLQNEKVRIYQRQLQASGTAARGQWFDASRQHFVPRSIRQTGQFIIDSTDAAEFFRHADWDSIPADKKTAASVLPTEKMLWGTLSNDTQIELGLEQPYVDRIEELQAQPAGPERDAQLAGAVAVYDEYRKLLQFVSTLKGPKIMKELKKAGVASCTEWKPIDGAKGVIGFSKLRGK